MTTSTTSRETHRLSQSFARDAKPERIYWDDKITGLGLRVGRKSKTWVYRTYAADGKPTQRKLGRFPEMDAQEARRTALSHAAVPPSASRPPSLQDALEEHVADLMTNGSPRTVEGYEAAMRLYIPHRLLRKRLDQITKREIKDLHGKITRRELTDASDQPVGGPYAANRTVRYISAAYVAVGVGVHDLPASKNPASVPKNARWWNEERPKQLRMRFADLPDVWAKIQDLADTVTRDAYVVFLFTGLRKGDVLGMRWEHVDLDAQTVHLPNPKGGESRAFTLPITEPVIEALRRRLEENEALLGSQDEGWVFPTRGRDGRVKAVSEVRRQGSDLEGPHQFRNLWGALAATTIGLVPQKLLYNHRAKKAGDVTIDHYIRTMSPEDLIEMLRDASEAVTREIRRRIAQ